MVKIVISIPVHEKPDVIKNQINNFKRFVKDSVIVLHISASFYEKYTLEDIDKMDGVYINPEHLSTAWGNIIQPHLSNFNYIKTQLEFEYFVMHASNDMYIKPGFDAYISRYDAGFNIRPLRKRHTHWWPTDLAFRDDSLQAIMATCGQTTIMASQVESSFYRRELMEQMVDIIEAHYKSPSSTQIYPREEIFFATIASKLVGWENVGDITTFSEVHRFDRTLWKIRNFTRVLYYKVGKIFMSESFYYRIEEFCNRLLFRSQFYKTTPAVIQRILKNDKFYLQRNSTLDDGSGVFRLYGDNLFSVKRINRDINDPVRQYITNKL